MSGDGATCWPFDERRSEPPPTPGHVAWGEVARVEPELARAVRARLAATKHHVLASLRADGSPRVSGTEVILRDDVLAIGSMWLAMKALDLRRDGRFALHSNPGDGSMLGGDAKVSGTAVELSGELAVEIAAELPDEVTEPAGEPEPFHLFRLDIAQVVLSEIDPDRVPSHQGRPLDRRWRPVSSRPCWRRHSGLWVAPW